MYTTVRFVNKADDAAWHESVATTKTTRENLNSLVPVKFIDLKMFSKIISDSS